MAAVLYFKRLALYNYDCSEKQFRLRQRIPDREKNSEGEGFHLWGDFKTYLREIDGARGWLGDQCSARKTEAGWQSYAAFSFW